MDTQPAAAEQAAAPQPAAAPAPAAAAAAAAAREGPLHPVCCAACDTEVGLWDAKTRVYVFFEAVASNS